MLSILAAFFVFVSSAANAITYKRSLVSDFGGKCDGVEDDRPAFSAFNKWARSVTSDTNMITLELPKDGRCMFLSSDPKMPSNRYAYGIKRLVTNGHGSTLESYSAIGVGAHFHLGAGAIYQPGNFSARLNEVHSGDTTVRAMDPSRLTLANGFAVGRYLLIAGIDMMGYGFPQNPYYFEYAKILALDTMTGQIKIDHPTRHFYRTTWPHYRDGSRYSPNQGGYAIAYPMEAEWDADITYNDIKVKQAFPTILNGQSLGAAATMVMGRKITLNNVKVLDGGTGRNYDNCVSPTVGELFTYNNVDESICTGSEADKITDTWIIKNSVMGNIAFQSSSFQRVDIINTKVKQIGGTPIRLNIFGGSHVENLIVGATQYGRTESITCMNSNIFNISSNSLAENVLNGTGISIADGVITWAKTRGAARFAIPDTNLIWEGLALNQAETAAPVFHITDVTDDTSNVYIKTDSTRTGWPAPATPGRLIIRVHPAPDVTFRNCGGSETALEISKAPAHIPLFSYINRTSTADKMKTTGAHYIRFFGKLTKINVNVLEPYAGPNAAFVVWPFGIGGINLFDSTGAVQVFNPLINGMVAGLRKVLPGPATPLTGDVFPALAILQPYYATLGHDMMAPVTSTTVLPIVRVEAQTDQNVMLPSN